MAVPNAQAAVMLCYRQTVTNPCYIGVFVTTPRGAYYLRGYLPNSMVPLDAQYVHFEGKDWCGLPSLSEAHRLAITELKSDTLLPAETRKTTTAVSAFWHPDSIRSGISRMSAGQT